MMLLLILAATGMSLLSYRGRLPAQNILAIGTLIFLGASALEWLARAAGFPLRSATNGNDLGFPMAPLLWLIFLLNARHLAGAILFFFKTQWAGYWRLILTSVFAAGFWLCLDLKSPRPWLIFFARILASAILLLLIFPWTIDKRKRS